MGNALRIAEIKRRSKELKLSMRNKQIAENKEIDDMEFRLTSESMELLIESIVDAVEFVDDRDMQFELVKTILEDNGIVEIKE